MTEHEKEENNLPAPVDKDIPEIEARRHAMVPFLGDQLPAGMAADGSIYLGLPRMCKSLGLTVQPQLRRMRRTTTLQKGLCRMVLQTPGGPQPTYCLRVDKVGLWLAGAETKRMENEEYRQKIDAYQERLAPIATEVFLQVVLDSGQQLIRSYDPVLAILAQQTETLNEIAGFLREHTAMLQAQVDHLEGRQQELVNQVAKIDERTQRLTPKHALQAQNLVERLAELLVQRKAHRSIEQARAWIYARVKTRYQAGSYKEISDERFNDLAEWLGKAIRRTSDNQEPEQSTWLDQ